MEKSKRLLEWAVKNNVDLDDFNIINVPDDDEQTEEWWFDTIGACPPCAIEKGTYLCVERSVLNLFPPVGVEVDEEAEFPTYDGFDYYQLFKL